MVIGGLNADKVAMMDERTLVYIMADEIILVVDTGAADTRYMDEGQRLQFIVDAMAMNDVIWSIPEVPA